MLGHRSVVWRGWQARTCGSARPARIQEIYDCRSRPPTSDAMPQTEYSGLLRTTARADECYLETLINRHWLLELDEGRSMRHRRSDVVPSIICTDSCGPVVAANVKKGYARKHQ